MTMLARQPDAGDAPTWLVEAELVHHLADDALGPRRAGGELLLCLLVIARAFGNGVAVDRLGRGGRVRRVHRLVERAVEPRFLALGVALEPLDDRAVGAGV